jgi:hypothetical protein
VKVLRLIPALAMGLAVHAAAAQSPTSGKPVDADAYLQGQSQQGAPTQANPMMQEVIQQSLGANPTPDQVQAAQQQLQGKSQPKGPQPMWALGVSNSTCGDVMNPVTQDLNPEATSWAQGFWTGLNTLDTRSHNVGKSVDPKTILDDITKHCAENHGMTLLESVSEIYALYLTNGK